jgi:hypothetical protein
MQSFFFAVTCFVNADDENSSAFPRVVSNAEPSENKPHDWLGQGLQPFL